MIGPRLEGRNGVALVPLRKEHMRENWEAMTLPETTRFWGKRLMDLRDERLDERYRKNAADQTSLNWAIAYHGANVGFTGLFGIDWVARDAESGIFIGRHDLYGRGIASEAIRLRTRFAWDELRLQRVHNWIALRNRGSRRANEKAGYRQMGRFARSWFRSGEWYDEWLGELLLPEALEAPAEGPSTPDR